MAALSKEDYLKRYLSNSDAGVKKKRKKKPKASVKHGKSLIIDDDVNLRDIRASGGHENDDEFDNVPGEEDPLIFDETGTTVLSKDLETIREKEAARKAMWAPVKSVSHEQDVERDAERRDSMPSSPGVSTSDTIKQSRGTRVSDDQSPLRRRGRHDTPDQSPPWRKGQTGFSDLSPPRRHKGGDPARQRNRHDTPDQSPPRSAGGRTSSPDLSPPRNRGRDSGRQRTRHNTPDQSPPRRKGRTASPDLSPPRNQGGGPGRQRTRHDTPDQSPPRRKGRITPPDLSPPRNRGGGPGRQRTRHDTPDQSPPRRKGRTTPPDLSPPRNRVGDPGRQRTRHDTPDQSPPRRKGRTASPDLSPPRNRGGDPGRQRTRHDTPDQSPLRRKGRTASPDLSPPRNRGAEPGRQRARHDTPDQSPPRHKRTRDSISPKRQTKKVKPGNLSPERKESKKHERKAGLHSAAELQQENELARRREDEMFRTMASTSTGKGAETVYRDREGRKRDLKIEKAMKQEEERKKLEEDEKFMEWGKGLQQTRNTKNKIDDAVYEMSKPLARYKDDEDLEEMLREKDRSGDPMLAFIQKKKVKQDVLSGKKEKPRYKGPPPPANRFNILPGYRWDGVDRSNGFEKKRFTMLANKGATREEAYKWSIEDM